MASFQFYDIVFVRRRQSSGFHRCPLGPVSDHVWITGANKDRALHQVIKYSHVIIWQIVDYMTKAGVKLTHTVGPTMWADKSWTIWHPISTICKCVWSTWSHKICILVSVKHFSPTNVCVMMFTEIDLSQTSNWSHSWTQEAVNMAAPCWKLLWGWYVSGFKLMQDQEWAKINGKSTRGVQFTSVREKQAYLKSQRKYTNHRQAEYHCPLKERKTVKYRGWDSNPGPLVYEASVLPTELSFRMKNWQQIIAI